MLFWENCHDINWLTRSCVFLAFNSDVCGTNNAATVTETISLSNMSTQRDELLPKTLLSGISFTNMEQRIFTSCLNNNMYYDKWPNNMYLAIACIIWPNNMYFHRALCHLVTLSKQLDAVSTQRGCILKEYIFSKSGYNCQMKACNTYSDESYSWSYYGVASRCDGFKQKPYQWVYIITAFFTSNCQLSN